MSSHAGSTAKKEDAINLDKILTEEVGAFGRFQLKAILLCAVVALLTGLQSNAYLPFFARTNTRCKIPECESILSPEFNFTPSWIHNAVPLSDDSIDQCHRYKSFENTSEICSEDEFDRNSVVECEEYVYEEDNTAFYELIPETLKSEACVVQRYGLACDDWRPSLPGSLELFGMMVSLPITGFVADRWGRRIAMSILTLNMAVIGCLKLCARSYIAYLVMTFVFAVSSASGFSCAYILALEYVGPEYRVLAGASLSSFLALGHALQGPVAWAIPYWRYLLLTLHAPGFIFLSYFWIAPESVRWLISKGRYEEAKNILKNAAITNGNKLSEKTLQEFSEVKSKEINTQDENEPWLICLVFKHKRILFRCIVIPVWWIMTLLTYYGLTNTSATISSSRFFNVSAVAAVEIPGYLTAALLLNRIGRKPLMISCFFICAACQIGYVFIHKGHYWLSFLMFLVGKVSISAVMTSLYVYTAELYPTRYRTSLLAYSSMIGRIGSIIAPLTPALGVVYWEHLPYVLFAGAAILAGFLVLLTPETLGTSLPDTMEDADNLGKSTPSRIMKHLRKFMFRRKCYTI